MYRFPMPGLGCAVVVMNDRCFSVLSCVGRTEDAPEHARNRRAVHLGSGRDWPCYAAAIDVSEGPNEFHRPPIGQWLEDKVTFELPELVCPSVRGCTTGLIPDTLDRADA